MIRGRATVVVLETQSVEVTNLESTPRAGRQCQRNGFQLWRISDETTAAAPGKVDCIRKRATIRSCRESFIVAGRAEPQITGLLPQLLGSIQVTRYPVATFVQEAEIGTAARIAELARSIKE